MENKNVKKQLKNYKSKPRSGLIFIAMGATHGYDKNIRTNPERVEQFFLLTGCRLHQKKPTSKKIH
jgi:hypothetical protein